MRNRYAGVCYRCGKAVAAGAGHFERHQGSWRTQHAECAIKHRAEKAKPNRSSDLQAIASFVLYSCVTPI